MSTNATPWWSDENPRGWWWHNSTLWMKWPQNTLHRTATTTYHRTTAVNVRRLRVDKHNMSAYKNTHSLCTVTGCYARPACVTAATINEKLRYVTIVRLQNTSQQKKKRTFHNIQHFFLFFLLGFLPFLSFCNSTQAEQNILQHFFYWQATVTNNEITSH